MDKNKVYWITAWPLKTYFAAFCDQRKSSLHQNPDGSWENHLGLPYWLPEQRYIASLEDYLSVIKNIECDEFVFLHPKNKKPLIRFFVAKGKSAIFNGELGSGMILLQYTEQLTAYRKRDDKLLGIESIFMGIDTRLSKSEQKKTPKLFPRGINTTDPQEANFSNFLTREGK